MPLVQECLDALKPPVQTVPSVVYGIKRLVPGRLSSSIQGIVIHNLNRTFEDYVAYARTKTIPAAGTVHGSMHYVVGFDGSIAQTVADADIAWGMQTYLGSFPSTAPSAAYPGWTVLPAANPGISLDHYVIHIGLAMPPLAGKATPYCSPCEDGRIGMNEGAYKALIQLLAYLKDEYNIPVDAQHIAAHEDIQNLVSEQPVPCLIESCLLCDVEAYCQTCPEKADTSFVADNVLAFVYGESASGCKIKISIDDLMDLMASPGNGGG